MKYKNFILPDPSGYWMLIEMDTRFVTDADRKEVKSVGGIILTERVAQQENYGMCIAKVIAMGPDCYNKEFKEKTGARTEWTQVDSTVIIQAHSGRIVPSLGQAFVQGQFQLITDQAICGNYDNDEFNKVRDSKSGSQLMTDQAMCGHYNNDEFNEVQESI